MLRYALAWLLITCASWSWSEEAAKPESKPEAKPTATGTTDSVTDPAHVNVTVTPSGTKYHTKDCRIAKAGKEESLKLALADGLEPCALCHPPVYDPTTIVVFDGGDNGKKYHVKGCKFAKGETTLAKAKADGLEPCKVCNPPPLPEEKTSKPSKSREDQPTK